MSGDLRRPPALCVALMLISTAPVASCTLEAPEFTAIGEVEVISTSPISFATDVPRDGDLSFVFSRPLDPGSLGSLPIDVTSLDVRQGGVVTYDPIGRRLTFRPRGLLRQSLAYDVVLDDVLRGLRHGAPVNRVTLTVVTGTRELDEDQPEPPTYEQDVSPILSGHCGLAGCHRPPGPAAALDLSTPQGVTATAIGTIGGGWPGWARIDPESAPWSYLIYKLLDEETIRGDSMPPGAVLSLEELYIIARWIDAGARVDLGPDGP